jgi:hypothetical protein
MYVVSVGGITVNPTSLRWVPVFSDWRGGGYTTCRQRLRGRQAGLARWSSPGIALSQARGVYVGGVTSGQPAFRQRAIAASSRCWFFSAAAVSSANMRCPSVDVAHTSEQKAMCMMMTSVGRSQTAHRSYGMLLPQVVIEFHQEVRHSSLFGVSSVDG